MALTRFETAAVLAILRDLYGFPQYAQGVPFKHVNGLADAGLVTEYIRNLDGRVVSGYVLTPKGSNHPEIKPLIDFFQRRAEASNDEKAWHDAHAEYLERRIKARMEPHLKASQPLDMAFRLSYLPGLGVCAVSAYFVRSGGSKDDAWMDVVGVINSYDFPNLQLRERAARTKDELLEVECITMLSLLLIREIIAIAYAMPVDKRGVLGLIHHAPGFEIPHGISLDAFDGKT